VLCASIPLLTRRRSAWPIAIFLLALAVRLLHVWQIRRAPLFAELMGDSRSYDEWAQRIAAGDWIGHDVFYQAPLYPYFLGAVYAIAGRDLLVVRVIQAVLGSVACVCVALAGRTFFSPGIGAAAGVILALYAPAIFFDGLIQKSTLDVVFLSVALWMMSRTYNAEHAEHAGKKCSRRVLRVLRGSSLQWLLLGLAIGALSLTRENAIVFTIVIGIWLLVEFSPRAPVVASFLAGLAIVILPVAIRNSIVGGGFYVTTAQFGPNFYIGNNPNADGTYQSLRFGRGAPEYERQDATEIAERDLGRSLTPAEVSGYWTDRALDFITGRPAEWLRLTARKIALLVNATEMLDTESQESYAEWSLPLRVTGIVGHFGVLVPLAVFGIIAVWPTRARWWVLAAMLSAYAASVVMFYVFARYRYPLVPMLVLFAAAGMIAAGDEMWRWVRRRPGATVGSMRWPALAAVAAAAVAANWPILSRDVMRSITEHNLGAALQADGRYDEALEHYRRALALQPDYAPAYNNMASTFRAKGDVRQAVSTYEQALRVRPDYPEAHYNLANALLDAGKSEEAVDHFERALQSMPASADVHNNLGIALAAHGKLKEAAAEFRDALRLDPNSAKAHRNLGDTLAALGAADESIDHLRQAVKIDPSDAAAHYDLGSGLLAAGKLDEAIAEFRAALKLTPDNVEAHNNLGVALGSHGQIGEAAAEFKRALAIKPDFADAKKNLAMIEVSKRRPR
jgi:tetratricopeptide (TPR) repeat protein